MRLTKKIIEISKKIPAPCLLFSINQVKRNYREIKKSINNVEVYYAMKANDHQTILRALAHIGSSFEISSLSELEKLEQLNVDPSRIICLNPIKNPDFLRYMEKKGIEIMAFDSIDEVDKIAKYAPGSKVVLRISVGNEDSDWPLTKKFGIDATEAMPLLLYAKKRHLVPYGLTFHVGSQCRNSNNWANALHVCNDVWKQAKTAGIDLTLISLGGGIPIRHTKKIPAIREIGRVVNKTLAENFISQNASPRISIEPGRGMVGDAAIMVTSVVGKAKRGKEDWIYIDVGVFNGLMETIQNFEYELKIGLIRKKGKILTIAGPSCDSVDIPFKNILLPNVEIGDRIYIINAGAYTTVYGANFNGFPVPDTYFID